MAIELKKWLGFGQNQIIYEGHDVVEKFYNILGLVFCDMQMNICKDQL